MLLWIQTLGRDDERRTVVPRIRVSGATLGHYFARPLQCFRASQASDEPGALYLQLSYRRISTGYRQHDLIMARGGDRSAQNRKNCAKPKQGTDLTAQNPALSWHEKARHGKVVGGFPCTLEH